MKQSRASQGQPQASLHANLLSRLDRVPITKSTVVILVLLSLVSLAEAFDIGIVGPVLTLLGHTWSLSDSQKGLLASASTLGVVLGMLPSGYFADRFGRRKVILIGIMSFSLITLLGTMVNNFHSILSVRFLAGLGEGAILPMPYLYLTEFMHRNRRAVGVGYANGILTAAYLLPNLASAWALSAFPEAVAWRIPFLLGGLPLLLLYPLYRWLPESPRFLARHGETLTLQRIVEKLEDEAGLSHLDSARLVEASPTIPPKTGTTKVTSGLWQRTYLGRIVMVSAQLTGALLLFYILQVYGTTVLQSKGLATGHALIFTAAMMGLGGVGSVAQGYLSDKYGRKRILGIYLGFAALGCGLFVLDISLGMTLLAGFLTSFFGLGIFPVSKLCIAEQYPEELRGRGVFFSEMGARFASGCVTLYFIPMLLDAVGYQALFCGIMVCLILLGVPYLLFGRETAGMSSEETGIISSPIRSIHVKI